MPCTGAANSVQLIAYAFAAVLTWEAASGMSGGMSGKVGRPRLHGGYCVLLQAAVGICLSFRGSPICLEAEDLREDGHHICRWDLDVLCIEAVACSQKTSRTPLTSSLTLRTRAAGNDCAYVQLACFLLFTALV